MSMLVARRGALFAPAAGGGTIVPPAFVGATLESAPTGSTQPITADAPAGAGAGDWQLTAVYCVSSSPSFNAPPSGWSLILDEAFEFPDAAATSTGRLGLFESTTAAAAQFSTTMTSDRVWHTVRLAYSGATRAAGAPLFVFDTTVATTHASPAIDTVQDNAVVVALGAAELADAGAGWGWTDLGASTARAIALAENAIESGTLGAGDLEVASPTSGVSATFTLATAQAAAMVSLVLNGAAA